MTTYDYKITLTWKRPGADTGRDYRDTVRRDQEGTVTLAQPASHNAIRDWLAGNAEPPSGFSGAPEVASFTLTPRETEG